MVSAFTPTARATLAVARLGLELSEDRVAEAAAACEARELDSASTMNLLIWSEALARAYAAIGRHDLARRWAVRAQARGYADIAVQHGLVLLAGAYADSGPHRDVALDRALAAAEEFDTAGARVLAGRARLLAGTLTGEEDRDRAVALLAEATGLFAGCAAGGLHDEAVRAQRRLGVRVPRNGAARDAGSPSGLSRRELDVARLVVRGLTNREIARRLFLSPRTVESHLAHTYLKLGIRSRAELATRLVG
jgi:DNA-binding CsgD family transcriptional regulator